MGDKDSPIQKLLTGHNFSPEEIDLIIDGIAKHSRRTDFIARHFDNKKRREIDKLPKPEGVLEYVILSDADILTQSRLEQGVKKIVCSRLASEAFRKEDAVAGRHSFAKTLASVMESAYKVNEVMHFSVTKAKAADQLKQVQAFADWLKAGDKIEELDLIEDYGEKKKKFDELIVEFFRQAKQNN